MHALICKGLCILEPPIREVGLTLLREAGYTAGLPEMQLIYNNNQLQSRWAMRVKHDLDAVGIPVTLKPVDNAQFGDLVGNRGKVAMALSDFTSNLPDPKDVLENTLHSRFIAPRNSSNPAFYSNPAFDAIVEQAGICLDPAQRMRLYRRAEQMIIADAPVVCLGHKKLISLRQPWVKGPLLEPFWLYRLDRIWTQE